MRKRKMHVNPSQQLVLPDICDTLDVVAGSLELKDHVGESGVWYNDCATQAIMTAMELEYESSDYDTVASCLQKRKVLADAERHWPKPDRELWMLNHISPCLYTVRDTLSELTESEWRCMSINGEPPTIGELAFYSRHHVRMMIVATNNHCCAVHNGIVYDGQDLRHRAAKHIMFDSHHTQNDDIDFMVRSMRESIVWQGMPRDLTNH